MFRPVEAARSERAQSVARNCERRCDREGYRSWQAATLLLHRPMRSDHASLPRPSVVRHVIRRSAAGSRESQNDRQTRLMKHLCVSKLHHHHPLCK